MSRDFDAQLLESMAVRRRRLRDAVVWGSLRTRRSAPEIVTRLIVGAVVAAVLCAGCVGWSLLQEQLAKRQQQQQQQQVGR